jgi:TrmH RNA methyltransferase
MSAPELKICGLEAVRARFRRDAGSILRLYFDYPTSRQIGVMAKALAAARRIYRCVEPAELERVAGTIHHGGIVAVVPARPPAPVGPSDAPAWAARREPVLVLDRIGNAHNLGALARTAAFFGIGRLVLVDDPTAARPNDAAYRVAEGGLEHLSVHATADLPAFLRALASAGFAVIGASVRGGAAQAISPAPHQAVALVLGNEEHGLAGPVAEACTRLVTLPGSGRMESLNVSAAGAVLLWEFFGRRSAKPGPSTSTGKTVPTRPQSS